MTADAQKERFAVERKRNRRHKRKKAVRVWRAADRAAAGRVGRLIAERKKLARAERRRAREEP